MLELTERRVIHRAARLDDLRARQSRPVPVLIVGGGINGISTFRELALQGIPAILIEKGDWCQGASSALSRMIHGGLRYLENGEFSLVEEAVTERDRLLKNAPHCVFPLRTTIPIDRWNGGMLTAARRFFGQPQAPVRRSAMLIHSGLTLYDLYTRRYGTLPKHALHDKAATRERWPDFADWVTCSASYFDAWISAPERLGLELIEDSERACPHALALNYLRLVHCRDGRVTLEDTLSGERFTLQPHVVVNAGGAWIDNLNQQLAAPAPRLIGGTKGSHLILDCPALHAALDGEMIYFENREGRICILFPWYQHVLLGTTDIRVDDPDEVVCESEERDYLLDALRFVFPAIAIDADAVRYTYCGVRPLPVSEAHSNGAIPRSHSLVLLPPEGDRDFVTLCLVGGKWTTFRRFGEEAADRVLRLLGERRRVSSAALPIGGGQNFPSPARRRAWEAQLAQASGLPPARITQLVTRYGTRAVPLIALLSRDGDRPLRHHAGYSENELRWLIRHEQVCRLEDLLLRRTALAIAGELTAPLVTEIAALLASALALSADDARRHLAETGERLVRLHGLSQLAPLATAGAETAAASPPAAG
ncbi:glycerol-3-phosphate dehydrogenase/oxidase [Pantoea sp. 1.19]|uniref:glycerol-3-phosphate dehydrogenase/oxidase n=1 Tax=Pantoea sp. 1.19 TaxID=1925589 RepID=UPI000948FB38|nr:glycerol-3-phosphate dehydrogenase/oxidase [Pantoea sp. 1.19]